MTTPNYARKVYHSVVEDVISNVREAFLDEGVDEQVLQELRQLWETKLAVSRALEPEQPDPVVQPSNIPYQVVQQQHQQHQQQQPQQTHMVQQGAPVHAQIPVPVQISTDGQISNAASMAFNAQGGMFPQALVNVNPGAQITLQQTANGQYILQALPPGVSQQQMVTLPQQQILQNQQSQIQVQGQNIPQLDGTGDEEGACVVSAAPSTSPSTSGHICCHSIQSSTPTHRRSKRRHRDSQKLAELLQKLPQFDGNHDTSSSDDDNFDDDDDDNDDDDKEDGEDAEGEEEDPLNSDDDVSEEDPQELFDTDNVVVCQFEKISRNKNKWKFNLKDGIMNLDGKDHVFQKGLGEADW